MLLFLGQDELPVGAQSAADTAAELQGKIEEVTNASSFQEVVDAMLSEDAMNLALHYGLRIVGVLVFLLLALIIAGWTKRICFRALQKARLDLTLSRFISNTIKWVVLLLAILACLPVFGIESTSFAAILAAIGFAVGFALQGTLSNLAAGMMLLIFRPFKIADYVKVGGEMGTVNEIDLFSTTLDTADNRRLIIPNGAIFGSTIENLTFHPKRRVDVAVGTDYNADLDQTRAVLEAAARGVPNILKDPQPSVVLKELGGSSIDWGVRVWVNTADYWSIREQLTRNVKMALDEANIGIPFPQLDVHLQNNNSPE